MKGISTDDFPTVLEAILGPQAKGLSASSVVRLKDIWRAKYHQWSKRSLADKRYVYVWADGVYCQSRLEEEKSCLLVVMGADSLGNKELLAVCDGYRESTRSWRELLLELRSRGLEKAPPISLQSPPAPLRRPAKTKAQDPVGKRKRRKVWVTPSTPILCTRPSARGLAHAPLRLVTPKGNLCSGEVEFDTRDGLPYFGVTLQIPDPEKEEVV